MFRQNHTTTMTTRQYQVKRGFLTAVPTRGQGQETPTGKIDIGSVLAQQLLPTYSVYPIPFTKEERSRLMVAYQALVILMQGLYCAPLPEEIHNVLDLGCGPDGRWCRAMSQHYPTSWVIGMDLAIETELWETSARCKHIVGDILEPLPFPDASMDYVHMANMLCAIPYEAWPDMMAEIVRVTRPGGYIELLEFSPTLISHRSSEPYGYYTRQILSWVLPMLHTRGIMPEQVPNQLGALFAKQNMRHQESIYTCTLGTSSNRASNLMTASILAALAHMTPALVEHIAPTLLDPNQTITSEIYEKTANNIELTISHLKEEWERHQTCIQLHDHWARKLI